MSTVMMPEALLRIERMNRSRALICVCVFFLQAVKLSHWALLRDSIYYTFAITALIVVRGHGVTCTHCVDKAELSCCSGC